KHLPYTTLFRNKPGAMGSQLFDNVVRVHCLDAEGEAHTRTPAELNVSYRHVSDFETSFAVSAVFRAYPATADDILRKLEASQEKRKKSQPIAKSAGCIFKNPEGCPAGQLVDELGLKNSHVGKARVSEVHGNFIVNDGGATASEVLKLIEQIRALARKNRGIELETEVQIVGEDA
ncbi:MAG: UDP-N-acetylenolpyruvoylglucosamine reductase, partial [Chthoniobacterales bacterium]